MNRQTNYLKDIEGKNHTPTFVSLEVINTTKKTSQPGKHSPIGKYEIIDHRTTGSNEIIWDLDFKAYATNYDCAKKISDVLINRGWPHNIYATGGKGVHISAWFNKIDFSKNNELKELFKHALKNNLTYKKIRFWLWRLVLEEAGLWNVDLCKDGGKFDRAPMNFIEEDSKAKRLRCCGGRKIIFHKELNIYNTYYKTYIPKDEFNKKKPNIKTFENVKFPGVLQLFDIDVTDFSTFLHDYIEKTEGQQLREDIKLDGSYVELQSVQKILEGMGQGQRAMGAQIVAIACYLDGFKKDRAYKLMETYVGNSSQVGSPFIIDEANRWVDWVYDQPCHFWNCSLTEQLGVHDKHTCAFCKQSKKEILQVLENKDLLKRIDKYLSRRVVGEKKNRMLTLLLLLSCKFPTDTEGWTPLIGDPKPGSVIFSSMSASGKSWLTKSVLRLFGQEGTDYYTFSRMTKSTLNYFGGIDMDNKILFTEELQGLDAESNQLRLWISEGNLKLSTVETVKTQGGQEANDLVIKKTKGQPVFITGTAEDSVDEQMNNRSWLISLDISEKQNEEILKFEDEIARGHVSDDKEELRILQEALNELESFHFIIPYYNYKHFNIPIHDVRIRRDYRKFRFLICCSALLHQRQRVRFTHPDTGCKYIVCNFDDYEIAKYYGEDVLQSTFSGLTSQQIEVANNIKQKNWAEEFEATDVQRLTSWSQSKVWTVLKQLEEIGLVISSSQGRGMPIKYNYNFKKQLVNLKLPTPEELMDKFKGSNTHLFQKMSEFDVLLLSNNKNRIEQKIPNLGIGVKNPDDANKSHEERLFAHNSKLAHLFLTTSSEPTVDNFRLEKQTFIKGKTGEKPLIIGGETQNSQNGITSTRERILKYVTENKNHLINIEDIREYLELTDEEIDEVIQQLKDSAEIFEPKAGKIMLL